MRENLNALFTPWKVGNVEIKNRIVMCPMGGTSLFGWMEPNHFDKEAANFILERAQNNVGLILPGIAPIKDPILGRWLYQNKKMFKDLKEFMDEFHKTGAKLFIQLTAGFGRAMAVNHTMELLGSNKFLGLLAKPVLNVDYLCASASTTPNRWSDKLQSRPLLIKEIQKMVDAFAKTAKLCMEACVDGVEVHAVHEGYLLDQFTLPYTNQRLDQYGGSFENRYRFPVEIVQAIKKSCGKDYPVSLRYSVVSKTKGFRSGAMPGEDYIEVGRDLKESEIASKYLQDAGYDMLNCDNGTYDSWYWAHPPIYMNDNCNLEEVKDIKKFVSIPVVCAGRMDVDTGAKSVELHELDAVGFARQFLTDPTWVTKLMNDEEALIKPCIYCHNACFTMCHYKGVANDQTLEDSIHMARCALNPMTMQHNVYKIEKTNHPKSIAIIGGGIGGMEAALLALKRGHKPTIFEKTSILGGVFIPASNMVFKERDRMLIEWYKNQISLNHIEVKYNTEITDLSKLNYDEYIIATGSTPKKPPIKGIENTIEACEYLNGTKEVGNTVAIIGGGLTGCEIAYNLFLQGKTPILVEMQNDLMHQSGLCLANSSYLRDYFLYHKIEVHLESTLKEVLSDSVTILDKNNNLDSIKCDSVIMSIGYNPSPIVKQGKNVHIVGDCKKVGNLRTVIWSVWDTVMKI